MNYTILKISISPDNIVFPYLKATDGDDNDINQKVSLLESSLINQKVLGIHRHGKYFWLRFSNSALLMHFGMTGMIKLKDILSHLTFMENGGDKKVLEVDAAAQNTDESNPKRLKIDKTGFANEVENQNKVKSSAGIKVEELNNFVVDPSTVNIQSSAGDEITNWSSVDRKTPTDGSLSGKSMKSFKNISNGEDMSVEFESKKSVPADSMKETETDKTVKNEPRRSLRRKGLKLVNEGKDHISHTLDVSSQREDFFDSESKDIAPRPAKRSKEDPSVWPPKFGKMSITLTKDDAEPVELIFVDPRRLAKIRVLNVKSNEELFEQPPLNAQGPDYSKPTESPKSLPEYGDLDPYQHGKPLLSVSEFQKLILSKRKPIKALLLEQNFFAGIGNWVADEIIYQTRILPGEVISSKLRKQDEIYEVIQKLYDNMIYVCQEAVRVEGNVRQFPKDWLMMFRWGKGRKKTVQTTNEGHEVAFVTVGGRTSCYVPVLQKELESNVGTGTDD